ncbi:MAG TPA: helix-turn-helix domain-containing protein [Orrella sp.]
MINSTYNITQEFIAACQMLDIESDTVLQQAGLQNLLDDAESLYVTPKQLAAVFDAITCAYGKDDIHLKLGNGFAKGAFGNAFLAMQCSETLREGVHRAARFKEVLEPVKWTITESDETFSVSIRSLTPDFPFNGYFQVGCLLWLVQSCRNITAKHIVPKRVFITDEVARQSELEQALGCPVVFNCHCLLEFSADDMTTRILSANRYMVNGLDIGVTVNEDESATDKAFVSLVYNSVLEFLPSGVVTLERIAEHLSVSKRTLERRLSKQGKPFSEVVRDCRLRMANHYLHQTRLPITEIAFLVGYQEINSFYRAFKGWSGRTPQEAREQRLN